MTFRYKLHKQPQGSAKYGPCEVCKNNGDTIYSQTEERSAVDRDGQFWTYDGCRPTVYGHLDCLEGIRRQ